MVLYDIDTLLTLRKRVGFRALTAIEVAISSRIRTDTTQEYHIVRSGQGMRPTRLAERWASNRVTLRSRGPPIEPRYVAGHFLEKGSDSRCDTNETTLIKAGPSRNSPRYLIPVGGGLIVKRLLQKSSRHKPGSNIGYGGAPGDAKSSIVVIQYHCTVSLYSIQKKTVAAVRAISDNLFVCQPLVR